MHRIASFWRWSNYLETSSLRRDGPVFKRQPGEHVAYAQDWQAWQSILQGKAGLQQQRRLRVVGSVARARRPISKMLEVMQDLDGCCIMHVVCSISHSCSRKRRRNCTRALQERRHGCPSADSVGRLGKAIQLCQMLAIYLYVSTLAPCCNLVPTF